MGKKGAIHSAPLSRLPAEADRQQMIVTALEQRLSNPHDSQGLLVAVNLRRARTRNTHSDIDEIPGFEVKLRLTKCIHLAGDWKLNGYTLIHTGFE